MATQSTARFWNDPFLLMLLGMVVLATLLPAAGWGAVVMEGMKNVAIVLLFFMHGAKLSRQAILGGFSAWRVHITALGATFILFPILGLILLAVASDWINPTIASGLLFICLLPSTVQSSIALTAMAGGNVPAAVCSASLSNLIGIALTPLLVSLLMHQSSGGVTTEAAGTIIMQLFLPFIAGHLARPLIGAFMDRQKALLGWADRSAILLVVYTAFSASVVDGLWNKIAAKDLLLILLLDVLLLATAMTVIMGIVRRLGFSRENEIAIVLCGSKKSLASGVPMASALFPVTILGPIILPLMLFHQLQLMACTVIAQRYAARASPHVSTVSRA